MSAAPQPAAILGLTGPQLAAAATAALPRGAGLAGAIYQRALRTGALDPEGCGASAASAARWRALCALALPRLVRRLAEATPTGRAEKLVLALADGRRVECVRIPMGARGESLCVSTQAGCRMACRFCETGRHGFARDLDAAEIVAQVVLARRLGAAPRQIVFQGMGEPLDNTENVLQALRVLADRRGLAYAQERLTVCTVGRSAGIAQLAALGWKRLNLALSLNAPDDALRRRLMPIARHEPLAALQRALIAYRRRPNLELAIHYCLLPGLNDAREHARGIARFCRPLGRAVVHLIPYNPGTAPLTRAPEPDEVERFVGWLREDGVPVRRRITKGRAVMAACGQLGGP